MVLRFLFGLAVAVCLVPACYSGGGGTAPPPNTFYYPVGLAVSNQGGNALYAVNSDFDLQWNGGTLQVYDLFLLRRDADLLINANLGVPGAPLPTQCSGNSPATADCIPFLSPWEAPGQPGSCVDTTPTPSVPEANGTRVPLGEDCAPAVDSTRYIQDSFTIGAFATQLQLSPDGSRLFTPVTGNASLTWADVVPDDANTVPPRDVTVAAPGAIAWTPSAATPYDSSTSPFVIDCAADASGQCTRQAGGVLDPGNSRGVTMPGEPFGMALTPDGTAVAITHQTTTQTSLLTSGCGAHAIASGGASDAGVADDGGAAAAIDDAAPDEGAPAAIDGGVADGGAAAAIDGAATGEGGADAATDGTAPDGGAAATSDVAAAPASPAEETVSLVASCETATPPSMQYVLGGSATPSNPAATAPPVGGLPNGGSGIAAIPHDNSLNSPARGCEYTNDTPPCVRPSFLEANHSSAQIDLLRYYNDLGSSLDRPFLVLETAFPLTANAIGTDQRGIAIDPTPRMACRARAAQNHGGVLSAADDAACGTVPSRVFIASRTPASLIVGQVGGMSADGTTFDPDLLVITGNQPVANGPSTVYLAPIVNPLGQYELRVFIVCFDSSQIFVYDPDNDFVENVINVGPGPFAMAFDPFDLEDVAKNADVPLDPRQVDGQSADVAPGTPHTLRRYRFAYVASFTQSFVQMIDLDDSLPGISPQTYENVVFTLGQPTPPKGS
jgi:hypothetical protein